jgi:endonuclease/exonuclease/phosphatase family metal-dependent hydrolase
MARVPKIEPVSETAGALKAGSGSKPSAILLADKVPFMASNQSMISRRTFLASTAVAAAAIPTGLVQAQVKESKPEGALDVMSYNLRYAAAAGPNNWPARRPVMRDLLLQERPDVFGTQEGVYPQLKDLASELPDYRWIGLGREGGSRGEFMAVFYRQDRLEPLEFDHFWLSDTPEVMGSTTWGNTNRRMVTWVRFEDRQTKRIFHFWNTHFDHQIETARQKSAGLIRDRIAKIPASTPVILLGDFNAFSGASKSYEILTQEAGLKDTWHAAKARSNEDANSFNDFRPLERKSQRIDWILFRGESQVHHAAVVTTKAENQWPSDHCPVTARLTWS